MAWALLPATEAVGHPVLRFGLGCTESPGTWFQAFANALSIITGMFGRPSDLREQLFYSVIQTFMPPAFGRARLGHVPGFQPMDF